MSIPESAKNLRDTYRKNKDEESDDDSFALIDSDLNIVSKE